MPNATNIHAPISLIAYGRSGTSVLSRAFHQHPDIDEVGETANCIFTPFRAVQQIKGITRFNDAHAVEAGADISRSAMLRLFASPKKRWFQKPIGIPRVFWEFGYKDSDKFIEWYWEAYGSIFPDAHTIATVRHPYDVFLSAREYWKYQDQAIWPNLELMMKVLTAGKGKILACYRFEDIVKDSEAALKNMCRTVELDFQPSMVSAFSKLHAPVPTDRAPASQFESAKARSFSRKGAWDRIVHNEASRATLAAYERLLGEFNCAEVPA